MKLERDYVQTCDMGWEKTISPLASLKLSEMFLSTFIPTVRAIGQLS